MDRFIAEARADFTVSIINLKSNMDRFIVSIAAEAAFNKIHLKSNMDRFIVVPTTSEV